jgi:FixJ family two-component response regulator
MARMLGRGRIHDALHRLSPRERDVRAAMAEDKSYRGIAKAAARGRPPSRAT